MGLIRAVLCFLLPPLAVIDKGCGSFLLVLFLSLIGWVPGIIGALIICMLSNEKYIYIREIQTRQNGGSGGRKEAIDVDAREL